MSKQKKKILVVASSLRFGGIQKSLLSFLNYISPLAEVDLLIWEQVFDFPVPQGVNLLNTATVKSVRRSLQLDGFFSKSFLLSIVAALFSKKYRWRVLPSLGKHYDVAIAYSNGGYGKYYVVDKVSSLKKYTFFHNGVYDVTKQEYKLDQRYYPKYNCIFAVSLPVKDMLQKVFTDTITLRVLRNLIDYGLISQLATASCQEMYNVTGIKILSVGRLSQEKAPLMLLEVAKILFQKKINFSWFIVGDGDMYDEIEAKIRKYNLTGCCFLCGGQINPYRFMKNCDIFVQLSKYEADSLTIREVAFFKKPMILSDIVAFKNFAKTYPHAKIESRDASVIADAIIETSKNLSCPSDANGEIDNVDLEARTQIAEILELG